MLLTGGWWIVRGADDPELDRAALFAGMGLSVVALAGARFGLPGSRRSTGVRGEERG